MPAPSHYRATFKGEFKSSATGEPFELWNTSIALRPGGSVSTASMQQIADDLRDDFAAWCSTTESGFAGNTWFTEVRLDHVGENGRIDQDAVFSPVSGGGATYSPGSAYLPPSCAVVLTLDTGGRGRSRFGRMYLPLLKVLMTNEGTIGEGQQLEILNSCATLLRNMSNLPGIDGGAGIVVASNAGGGALKDVQSIRVGRVVDTMRSRRRSMDESYRSVTL